MEAHDALTRKMDAIQGFWIQGRAKTCKQILMTDLPLYLSVCVLVYLCICVFVVGKMDAIQGRAKTCKQILMTDPRLLTGFHHSGLLA